MLLDSFLLDDLACSLVVDLFYLVRSESFEVIWHISVASVLADSGVSVLSHDIAHIGIGDLLVIPVLLVISPVLLSLSLLVSQTLIILLKIFELLLFPLGCFVFEHASHPGDGLSLLGVLFLLTAVVLTVPLVLSHLLFAPLTLDVVVFVFSLAEVCILVSGRALYLLRSSPSKNLHPDISLMACF